MDQISVRAISDVEVPVDEQRLESDVVQRKAGSAGAIRIPSTSVVEGQSHDGVEPLQRRHAPVGDELCRPTVNALPAHRGASARVEVVVAGLERSLSVQGQLTSEELDTRPEYARPYGPEVATISRLWQLLRGPLWVRESGGFWLKGMD